MGQRKLTAPRRGDGRGAAKFNWTPLVIFFVLTLLTIVMAIVFKSLITGAVKPV